MIDGAPAIRHDALLICGFPVGSHVARRVYGINVTFFPLDFFFLNLLWFFHTYSCSPVNLFHLQD